MYNCNDKGKTSVYVGEFKKGKRDGQGKFVWSDGSIYSGSFVENQITGFGVYAWSDGRRYEGFWNNGKMNGKGKFTWPEGKYFEGVFINDKKQGHGIMYWPGQKKQLECDFKDDLPHGFGYLQENNGPKKKGEWKLGQFVRWIDQVEEKQLQEQRQASKQGARQ